MPCITPLASGRELEFGWVTELLKEVNGQEHSYKDIDYRYWSWGSKGLDKLTADLCAKCKALGQEKIEKMSPQLQYWWAKHQRHDELRAIQDSIRTKHGDIDLPDNF